MPVPAQKLLSSVADYFRREDKALDKHEFHEGEILAMSGNTYSHCLIALNAGAEIRSRIKGSRCRAVDCNMRVGVIPGRYVYPDITIVRGEPQFDPLDPQPGTLLNPRVIIEVLSASTEAYDRGEKFTNYRQISSLEEYVLISQCSPQIETFLRREDGTWLFSAWSGVESTAKLQTLRVDLPLSEVYSEINFLTRVEVVDAPPE